MTTVVDTNVLLDVVSDDQRWGETSLSALRTASSRGPLIINIVIFAELAAGYGRPEHVDDLLAEWNIGIGEISTQAAFVAGHAFKRCRLAGGVRTGVLPDFFIGAHAEVDGFALMTRDPRRYRTYFPHVELIVPAL